MAQPDVILRVYLHRAMIKNEAQMSDFGPTLYKTFQILELRSSPFSAWRPIFYLVNSESVFV